MIDACTDLACGNIFALLNEGPLTLTIFLHTVIVLPMFFIYFQEKKRVNEDKQGEW